MNHEKKEAICIVAGIALFAHVRLTMETELQAREVVRALRDAGIPVGRDRDSVFIPLSDYLVATKTE